MIIHATPIHQNWIEYRAIFDNGSNVSIMTHECARKLHLRRQKINTLVSCLIDALMTISKCVETAISN